MAKVHHTGDFCRLIFSDMQYLKLLNPTCKHSGCGGFIVSEGVKYDHWYNTSNIDYLCKLMFLPLIDSYRTQF